MIPATGREAVERVPPTNRRIAGSSSGPAQPRGLGQVLTALRGGASVGRRTEDDLLGGAPRRSYLFDLVGASAIVFLASVLVV
ncbi:hypothetical protein OH736_45295 (plasmid) [Streptomyces sp. NBC_01650]|uniref:hypothetical protein n=1 Tax=Streptomyces sp. NBC_01650 TaxID=2975907 RepID=UPI0038649AB2|nr:hypothetical protein OH736_45295 [Streptomyces sp. NBC_01650]